MINDGSANRNRITTLPLTDFPGVNKPFTLAVECFDGFQLSAAFITTDDPAVRFWAKASPGDSFQNLHTTPLDLSPFDGQNRTIYFECRAAGGAIKQNSIVSLLVAMPA